jgi:UPF0755 protein
MKNFIIKYRRIFILIGSLLVLAFLGYYFLLSAPRNFPLEKIISIKSNSSLREISLKLKQENVIRSRIAFEAIIINYTGDKFLKPADYLFKNKMSVFAVAQSMIEMKDSLAPIKITIPEGLNNLEIAQVFSSKLKSFDQSKFLLKTKDKQGYLFPDTYFFHLTDNEEIVLKLIDKNFREKIELIKSKILNSGKSEREIIIMASIIEKEAKGAGDRRFISGILWRRLINNMLLQADAAPETYKTKGLPEFPISNPSLASIEAALYPEFSENFYYLHDRNGSIHVAKNFTEHQKNIRKYLND